MKKEVEKLLGDNPFLNMQETVYRALYRKIISMDLEPGSTLSEVAIASELGSSRTPVRNAIMMLEDKGLVVRSGKMMKVAVLDKNECMQLMEARTAIEGYAAYLAAERIAKSQLKELEDMQKKFEEAYAKWDIETLVASDHGFHRIVIQAAGNEFLERMYESISPKNLHYRNYLYRMTDEKELKPLMKTSLRHHTGLLNAIKLGLAEHAESRMRRDISGMGNIVNVW